MIDPLSAFSNNLEKEIFIISFDCGTIQHFQIKKIFEKNEIRIQKHLQTCFPSFIDRSEIGDEKMAHIIIHFILSIVVSTILAVGSVAL